MSKPRRKQTSDQIALTAMAQAKALMQRVEFLQEGIDDEEWQFMEALDALHDALEQVEDVAHQLEGTDFIFPE